MNLFFRKSGEGYPLIILHGLFGSSDNWQNLARKFGNHFSVFTPDLRNHGLSPQSELMDYDSLSGDLKTLIENQGLGEIFLIGHSLGGKAAMHFSLHYPDIVKKLIVVDIAPKFYDVIYDKYIDSLLNLNIGDYSKREEVDKALAESIGDKSIRQLLLKNLQRDDGGNFSWKLNLKGIRKNLSLLSVPITSDHAFPNPALFIAGEQSGYIQKSDIAGIKTLFPSCELIYIRNAGHWVHAEEPEQFYKVVLKFLNG